MDKDTLEKAKQLQCPITTAEYVVSLEARLEAIEARLKQLEDKLNG
jgi:hypothetical protein